MLLEKIEELLKEVSSLTAKNAEDVEQLRLKYLIQEKKYTIEGARAELLQEAATAGSQSGADTLIPQLNRIRFELLDLYRMLHHSEKEEPQ